MNSPVTALHSTQCKQEHADTAETPVWSWPASDISVPWIVPNPHHHTMKSEMWDPLSLRYHTDSFIDPHQYTQCQLTCPDYFLQPLLSQNHLVSGPVFAAPDGSHHSSASASWFTNEPNLCSMMPPVVHNASRDEHLTLVKPRKPGPVFSTTESAPTERDDAVTRGKEATALGTSSKYQAQAQDPTVKMLLPERTVGMLSKVKSRKPCRCAKSQCLKLYCECFASGLLCTNCDCSNCCNNGEHELKRIKAIEWCLVHNPSAFMPKIAGGKSGEVKGWHNKGCKCKRSGCLKRYCECYQAGIMCTSCCKCVGCRNYDISSQIGSKEEAGNAAGKWPVSVITPSVVEGVCVCLVAQAEKAERNTQSAARAERMVLKEFGCCLSQIAEAMFKNKAY